MEGKLLFIYLHSSPRAPTGFLKHVPPIFGCTFLRREKGQGSFWRRVRSGVCHCHRINSLSFSPHCPVPSPEHPVPPPIFPYAEKICCPCSHLRGQLQNGTAYPAIWPVKNRRTVFCCCNAADWFVSQAFLLNHVKFCFPLVCSIVCFSNAGNFAGVHNSYSNCVPNSGLSIQMSCTAAIAFLSRVPLNKESQEYLVQFG